MVISMYARMIYYYSLRCSFHFFFLFTVTPTTEIYTLSLHDALPISQSVHVEREQPSHVFGVVHGPGVDAVTRAVRSEEHTSELQSHSDLVCRLLLEKKKRDATRNKYGMERHTWL